MTDCCRCCVAATERGEDIGHVPGPGACPHPACDYCPPLYPTQDDPSYDAAMARR